MRLVFGARAVVQHLQAFAVFNGPLQQLGNALFNGLHQRTFAALEEHAVAGAVVVHLFAAGLRGHGERTGHARACGGNQGIAFLGREEVAKHHHAGFGELHQHLHLAVACVQQGGRIAQQGLGHRHRTGFALLHGQLVQVLLQRGLHGVGGHVFVPARVAHGLQHHRGRKARLGLLDDPAAQLGRDGLGRRLAGAGGALLGGRQGHVQNLKRVQVWTEGKTSVGLAPEYQALGLGC